MKKPSAFASAALVAAAVSLATGVGAYAMDMGNPLSMMSGTSSSPAGSFMSSSDMATAAYHSAIMKAQQAYDAKMQAGSDKYAAADQFNQAINGARDAFNQGVTSAQGVFNGSAYTAPMSTAMPMTSQTFRTHLQGDQQVPAVNTPAYGEFMASYVAGGDSISYTVSAYNLTGLTMGHLHLGAAGTTGPVVVPFMITATGATVNGQVATGTIRASDLTGPLMGMTLQDLMNDMRSGMIYANLHTAANPAGEIRGQVSMR